MKDIKKKNKNIFMIIIFLSYILSNSIFLILRTTSLRNSMIVGMIICLFFLLAVNNKKIFSINKEYLVKILILATLGLLQFFCSRIIFKDVNLSRFLGSYLLILICLLISPFFLNFIKLVDEVSYNSVIIYGYYFMTTIGVISTVLNKINVLHGKNMIIFSEPSHFALVYLPFLLYKAYCCEKNKKLLSILIGVIIAIAIENLTLMVGICVIIMLVYFQKRNVVRSVITMILIISTLLLAIKFLGTDKVAYFSDRLQFSSETNNLSTLVWLSGWERAYLSFINSYGIGIGFQQMGIVGEVGNYMHSIYKIMGGFYLNMTDGGSTGSKLIAEVGIVGVILIVIYIVNFLKIAQKFIGKKIDSNKELFLLSIYVMMSMQLFVRGVGYFSPSTFMFFVAVYWVCVNNNKYKKWKISI